MQDPFLAEHVQAFVADPTQPQRRAALLRRLRSIQELNQSLRVVLLDPQMRLQLAVPESDQFVGPIAENTALNAMCATRPVFSDLHASRRSGKIHLDLAIPLSADDAGSPAGVIFMEVDPYQSLYSRILEWPTSMRDAETLLVRREGDDVVFLNELRHRSQTALALRVPMSSRPDLPSTLAVMGHEGIVGVDDYRHVPVLAAVRAIPDSPWRVVVKIDQDEIFAPLRERVRTTTIIAVGIVVLIALGILVFSRQHDNAWLRRELAAKQENETRLRGPGGRRGRQSGQEPVPGQHEPRDSHADHGDPWVHRLAVDQPALARRTARFSDDHPAQREGLARVNQRHSRSVQDRSGKMRRRAGRLSAGADHRRRAVRRIVSAREKGLALDSASLHLVPKTIRTDPRRLRQVLVNLIGNAVKFTDHGAVRLAARLVGRSEGRPLLELAVCDTGIGIAPERMGDLFRPFTQIDGSSTRSHGGTGLGLVISRRLAQSLGGDIAVQSELGKGSTFTVTIDPGPVDAEWPARSASSTVAQAM